MRRPITAVLLTLGVLSLAGCDKLSQLTKSGSASGDANATASSSAPSDGSIGVSQCDDYIRVYKQCIVDKVPEGERGTLQSGLDTNVDYWRQLAANPDAKAKLAEACQEARDTAQNLLSAYGCNF